MLIGELSNKTGLTRDTIRFYEKQGLISVGRKERRDNNYKEYSQDTFQKLLSIKRIRSFGFTLNETAEFLELIKVGSATCDNVAEKMLEKTKRIEEKITELQMLKSQMLLGINVCINNCCETERDNCQVLTTI